MKRRPSSPAARTVGSMKPVSRKLEPAQNTPPRMWITRRTRSRLSIDKSPLADGMRLAFDRNGGLDETGQQKPRAGPEHAAEDVDHAQDEKQVEHRQISFGGRDAPCFRSERWAR